MILIGISLILINYLLLGFKPNTNILSCGLAGFYPKPGKQGDIEKIFMMGIMNEQRGTDNCGMTIGNERFTGLKGLATARDFINIKGAALRKVNLKNKAMIFHTRKSSFGSSQETNVHPFILETDNKYFVLAHNGVLRTEHELKRDFFPDVPHIELSIDSHYLLHGLARAHYSDVDRDAFIKAYKGDAALLYYTNNTFHAWKGGHNNIEERPMYYIETPEGWYFCSIDTTLMVLWQDSYEVHEVENNQLVSFIKANGRIKIVKEIIERKTAPVVHTPAIVSGYLASKNWTEEDRWNREWDYATQSWSQEKFEKTLAREKALEDLHSATTPIGPMSIVKRLDNRVSLNPNVKEDAAVNTIVYNSLISSKLTNSDSKALHGKYRSHIDPLRDQNILALYLPSNYKIPYICDIHHGVHIKDASVKNLLESINNKWHKATNANTFFKENKKYLHNIVVDYMPFMHLGQIYLLVYRNLNGELESLTGFDRIASAITIHPGIGQSLKFSPAVHQTKKDDNNNPMHYVDVAIATREKKNNILVNQHF